MHPALQLRPLTMRELLDGVFSLYRRHFVLFFGLASVPAAFPLFVLALIDRAIPTMGEEGGWLLLTVGFPVLGLTSGAIALFWWAALARAASAAYLGEEVSFRVAAGHALRRYPTMLAGALIGMLLGAAVMILSLVLAAVRIELAGLVFMMLQVTVLATAPFWVVVASLEPVGPEESMKRTRALLKRAWIQTMGTVVFLEIIAAVIGSIVYKLVAALARTLPFGALTMEGALGTMGFGFALGTPVLVVGITLFYHDRRVRAEALDLEAAPAPAAALP